MNDMEKEIRFDWDQWNVQKNERKHGVSKLEAESVFFDANYGLFVDIKHSTSREKRYILYGKSLENRILMVGFTMRRGKVRIITARSASKKERETYHGE
ncbi:BrnT family toxin [Oligoflexia bacterium]|nr:BrnT family toxin [Oligoflexia bacterium]